MDLGCCLYYIIINIHFHINLMKNMLWILFSLLCHYIFYWFTGLFFSSHRWQTYFSWTFFLPSAHDFSVFLQKELGTLYRHISPIPCVVIVCIFKFSNHRNKCFPKISIDIAVITSVYWYYIYPDEIAMRFFIIFFPVRLNYGKYVLNIYYKFNYLITFYVMRYTA